MAYLLYNLTLLYIYICDGSMKNIRNFSSNSSLLFSTWYKSLRLKIEDFFEKFQTFLVVEKGGGGGGVFETHVGP